MALRACKAIWRGRKLIGGAILLIAAGLLVKGTGFPPPLEGPTPLAGNPTYVALGDSYSAGEGLFPYLLGTRDFDRPGDNDRCHRSQRAYGGYLAGDRGADDLTFQFKACSGAVISDITNNRAVTEGSKEVPPQLTDVNFGADLVTMTIGGNDAKFADVLKFCALTKDCFTSPKWVPVKDGPPMTLSAWARTELPLIRERLRGLYDTLRSEFSSDTRIIVLGYPRLFSEQASTGQGRRCTAHNRLFDASERKQIADLGDRLNAYIADEAIQAGLEYVEVADAFDGHETCGSKGPWIGFLAADAAELGDEVDTIFTGSIRPGNFHPTSDGQVMMARLIRCYLDEHPTNPYNDADGDVAVGRKDDAVYKQAVDGDACDGNDSAG